MMAQRIAGVMVFTDGVDFEVPSIAPHGTSWVRARRVPVRLGEDGQMRHANPEVDEPCNPTVAGAVPGCTGFEGPLYAIFGGLRRVRKDVWDGVEAQARRESFPVHVG